MNIFPNGIQGLSDTKWSGVLGSAHRLVGVDYRSQPGAIQANQALSKISGAVVDELCKVSLPLSDGSTLWFSSESGKIWREVADTFTLLGSLTIPGFKMKVTNATYSGLSKNYEAQISSIGISHCFKDNGLSMYVLNVSNAIFQYTLTEAYNVSTATYATKTFATGTNSRGLFFKPGGTKFYICEDMGTTNVVEYEMSTAWDISTASATGVTYNFGTQFSRAYGIVFKPDGTEMYLWDGSNQEFRQYTLSTAWDITSATYTAGFNIGAGLNLTYGGGGFITSDGTTIIATTTNSFLRKYEMTTPWDITTAVFRNEYKLPSGVYFGLNASPDNSKFYVGTQDSPETVFQYDLGPSGQADADPIVTVLGAEEFAVPDGADGPDENTFDDEMTQYVYFATKDWLLRTTVADILNITNLNENGYLTQFKNGDEKYHPVKKSNGRLYFGDKHTICVVNEAGVITLESDFSIREPERITILENFDVDLLIGTTNVNGKSRVLRWDTESPTWYGEDFVYEDEIHAFLDEDNYTYAIVGDSGQMHYYDGEKLLKHKRIPGVYSKTARCKVNANAVGYFMGVPIFGLTNVEGNPNLQGVYAYGQYSKDYNITMDLSFPISSGEFAGIEIGSIVVQGFDVYVSWKSATAQGVDKLNWSLKYNGAYIETMVLNSPADRAKFKSVKEILADYIEMPADTSLTMQYSNNYAAYVTHPQQLNDKLLQLRGMGTVPEVGSLQARFVFVTDGNNSPVIENLHVNFVDEE